MKCSASRAKSSFLAASVALEAILSNSAACSRSLTSCARISSMRTLTSAVATPASWPTYQYGMRYLLAELS